MHLMRARSLILGGNFLCAIHYALVIYALSPYLATFMEQKYIGLVFAFGAILTLLSFPLVPRIVEKFGGRTILVALAVLTFFTLLCLVVLPIPIVAILLVAILCSVQPFFTYLLDVLLETTISSEEETGRARALYMSIGNLAFVSAPFITGIILGPEDAYHMLFIVSAVTLIPFTLLFLRLRTHEVRPKHVHGLGAVLHCLLKDPDMRNVLIANATLQFFYHLAPFYIPLYLHTVLQIPWTELGWMFTVMLLPFVLLEYPVGWLADKKVGDRELMALGFLIMGGSFAAIAFVTSETALSALLITLVLTRVGASMVEATAEGHFFRKVSSVDANSVGILRMTRPVSAVLAPLTASIMLMFTSYSIFFLLLGLLIVCVGVTSALSVRDMPQLGSA